MKHKRLIYMQIIINVEVYLNMVRGIIRSQEAEVLEVLKASCMQAVALTNSLHTSHKLNNIFIYLYLSLTYNILVICQVYPSGKYISIVILFS